MLFTINNRRCVFSEKPYIVDEYEVLHYDEIPMLYCGKNKFGDCIIGNVMCEHEEKDIVRHICFILTESELTNFKNRTIDYRTLIDNQSSCFIIDRTHDSEPFGAPNSHKFTYWIPINEIPQEYLPHKGIYCPQKSK